jgi:hypothetical protein
MRTIGALALEEMIMATAMVGMEVIDQVQSHRKELIPPNPASS